MGLDVPLHRAAGRKQETTMRQTNQAGQSGRLKSRLAALAALLLVGASEAMAQNGWAQSTRPVAERNPEPERRIVVSVRDRKLALVENGRVVKIYSVAVGAPDSPSPTGEFRIAQRLTAPTYYAPGVVIPPGPENPLGPRWIGLSLKGYGIHGTNQPRSIGQHASHGCIRMRNRDVQELFELVRAGDVVELHGERDAVVASIFGTDGAPVAAGLRTAAYEFQPAVAAGSGEDNR
jgi:hypothetical protein